MKSKAADQSKIEHAVIVCSGDVIAEAEAGLRVGMALARATSLARDLANLPPNVCTPAYLAEIAVRIAGERGLQVEVLERGQMQALQMGALLAVAQAAHNPPRFIVLQHNAHRSAELDTLVLVGKGVTFDTGGYSLKTRDGMIGMKGDMSGAAGVGGHAGRLGTASREARRGHHPRLGESCGRRGVPPSGCHHGIERQDDRDHQHRCRGTSAAGRCAGVRQAVRA
ncbi:MAG: hypothetical protein HND48_08875 [Chloroflexi bacterium]|nr:hypothetical protein [Chloroflexota bacterium]